MDPKVFREWVRNLRDVVIILVATFMIVWEVVSVPHPNIYVIGGGLTLFGLPPALRLDYLFRSEE